MENATKALLIAAAVLIAIVLIALGVRLIGAARDPSSQATNVAGQLDNSMSDQVQVLSNGLNGLPTK